MLLIAVFLAAPVVLAGASRIAVSADGNGFVYNGQSVFLSGANQPWLHYGSDFGNNQTNGVACALQEAVANVSTATAAQVGRPRRKENLHHLRPRL